MIKKGITFAAFLIFISIFSAKAQDYKTGLGLRLGPYYGVTLKHFIGEDKALEGILVTRWNGFEVTGLHEWHAVAFEEPRLKVFYGVGGHIGFWDDHPRYDDPAENSIVGIDGILGLEYTFKEAPFNLALDWKPAINFVGYQGFGPEGGAFTIRYTFK